MRAGSDQAQRQRIERQALEAVEQRRRAGEHHPAKALGDQEVGQRDDQQARRGIAEGGQVADLDDLLTRHRTPAALAHRLLDGFVQIAFEKQRPAPRAAQADCALHLAVLAMQAEQAGHEVLHACAVVLGETLTDETFQRGAPLAGIGLRQLQAQRRLAADTCQYIGVINPGQFHRGTSVRNLGWIVGRQT